MFEWSISKKYVLPKRRQLSLSLVGFMAVFVISIVIWLLVLFLSVTEGIEKSWLKKLTSLNAPVKITPTDKYYSSYYYQIDGLSSASNYTLKSIGEKLISVKSDPYTCEADEELPLYWPNRHINNDGHLLDPVKTAFSILEELKKKYDSLEYEDYEATGALLKLKLIRNDPLESSGGGKQTLLTQASYVASTGNNGQLCKLIQKPTKQDINNLLEVLERSDSSLENFSSRYMPILSNIKVKSIQTKKFDWLLQNNMIPQNKPLKANACIEDGNVLYVLLSEIENAQMENMCTGLLTRNGDTLRFTSGGKSFILDNTVSIFSDSDIEFVCDAVDLNPEHTQELSDILLSVSGKLQGHDVKGVIPWSGIKLDDMDVYQQFETQPQFKPPWIHYVDDQLILSEGEILLPINFRESNVFIGDKGQFSYGSQTMTSVLEQKVPVSVCGFYDPGFMSVGARCVLANKDDVRNISSSNQTVSTDHLLSNGIQVFFKDLQKTEQIAKEIATLFKENNIDLYWNITPFYKYDVVKDIMNQFKSDRYMFILIGVIILFVACCNIISLLLLLVNDKKHEIGILLSLGARKRSIALIFGLCGLFIGCLSCTIGIIGSYFTLCHIDSLVSIINMLEGQQAFNAMFYGTSLPKDISSYALTFALIATPILSIIAGLIPAIKACRINVSEILRSE